jgi:hypothetical protein
VRQEQAVANAEAKTELNFERRAPRERAFLAARISYGNGAISMPCTVMQISASGARLNLLEAISLPDVFQIAIPQRSVDCRATLVWRRGDVAAVAFQLGEAGEVELTLDAAKARIKALLAENDKLKARVGELSAKLARLNDD